MTNHHRHSRMRNPKQIENSRRYKRELSQDLRRANQVCMVPRQPSEPPEENRMRNCHRIGKEFLRRPSDSSDGNMNQIYSWPSDVSYVYEMALQEIKADWTADDDVENSPKPIAPLKRHIDYWKYTVACCYHDNSVYKKIDDPRKFEWDDSETRFLLCLRSLTSYMAFMNGYETWAMSELTTSFSSFMDRVLEREMQSIFAEEGRTSSSIYKINSFLKDMQDAERLAERTIRPSVERLRVAKQDLQPELDVLYYLYVNRKWTGLVSERRTVRADVNMAGTGLLKLSSGNIGVATLLPRNSRKSDGYYVHDIIVSTTKPVSFPTDELADVVERRSPAAVIEYLATRWEFFCVSPQDYDDSVLIGDSERKALEIEIARAKLGPNWLKRATALVDHPDIPRLRLYDASSYEDGKSQARLAVTYRPPLE